MFISFYVDVLRCKVTGWVIKSKECVFIFYQWDAGYKFGTSISLFAS